MRILPNRHGHSCDDSCDHGKDCHDSGHKWNDCKGGHKFPSCKNKKLITSGIKT